MPEITLQYKPDFRRTQQYWDALWNHEVKGFHAIAEHRLEGQCLLCEIDMHANVDLLEGLRGAQNLICDMIAEPETILTAMQQARAIYRPVYETFYQYEDKPKWGSTSNLPMCDRGRYNWIQLAWPEVLPKIQDAGKIIILHVTMDDVKRIHGEYDPALAFLDWLVEHT